MKWCSGRGIGALIVAAVVTMLAAPVAAAPGDRDGDGIPDASDLCPNHPEDRDGFEDADGCPDPDNDKDGIPDVRDRCPNDPETYNGYKDKDGCPDRTKVRIVHGCPPIKNYIYFRRYSSKLRKITLPILNMVAAVLKKNPQIKRLQLRGHADDHRSAKADLRLSVRRAQAVYRYLVKKGVRKKRLSVKGLGRTKWRTKSRKAAERTKNRRVGFEVLKKPKTPVKRKTPAKP